MLKGGKAFAGVTLFLPFFPRVRRLFIPENKVAARKFNSEHVLIKFKLGMLRDTKHRKRGRGIKSLSIMRGGYCFHEAQHR